LQPNVFSSGLIFLAVLAEDSWRDLVYTTVNTWKSVFCGDCAVKQTEPVGVFFTLDKRVIEYLERALSGDGSE